MTWAVSFVILRPFGPSRDSPAANGLKIDEKTTHGPLSPRRHRRDAYEPDAVSDHVHQLHLTYISSRAISSPFQRSLVLPLQSLLDAEIIFNEIIKVVLVK